jgi:hypothetical protein
MGQGGYGVDQSYLWYMRAGRQFEHDVQIFAFIGEDFTRALANEFLGYAKPVLKIENGELKTGNVPTARTAYAFRWLTDNRASFDQLRSLKLLRTVFRQSSAQNPEDTEDKTGLFYLLFDSLKKENAVKGSTLELVYLPTRGDLYDGRNDALRDWLFLVCAKNGLKYLWRPGASRSQSLSPAGCRGSTTQALLRR